MRFNKDGSCEKVGKVWIVTVPVFFCEGFSNSSDRVGIILTMSIYVEKMLKLLYHYNIFEVYLL